MDSKVCPNCGTEKPLDQFSKRERRCKWCVYVRDHPNVDHGLLARKRASTTKRCPRCGLVKLKTDFAPRYSRGDTDCYCKPCRTTYNRENGYSKNTYGLGRKRYQELYAEQGGKCAICGVQAADRYELSADHDHATGKVRGLLCKYCNRALGVFGDSAEGVSAALEYLLNATVANDADPSKRCAS